MINLKNSRTIPCSFIKHVVFHSCIFQKLLTDSLADLENHSKQGNNFKKKRILNSKNKCYRTIATKTF